MKNIAVEGGIHSSYQYTKAFCMYCDALMTIVQHMLYNSGDDHFLLF